MFHVDLYAYVIFYFVFFSGITVFNAFKYHTIPGAKREDAKILRPPKKKYFRPKIFAPGAKRKDAKILKLSKEKLFRPKIFAPGAKRKKI